MSFTIFPRHRRYGPSTWSNSSSGTSSPSDGEDLSPIHDEDLPINITPSDTPVESASSPVTDESDGVPAVHHSPQKKPSVSPHVKEGVAKTLQKEIELLPKRLLKSSLRCTQSAPSTPTHAKSVKFDPVALERILFFQKTQMPSELKSDASAPMFRLQYVNWPPRETTDYYAKNVVVDKNFKVQNDNAIKGTVHVRNLAYEKHVAVRYTLDCWQSYHDTKADYEGPAGGTFKGFDTFVFKLDLDTSKLADRGHVRGTVDFAVRYTIHGQDHWENNDGGDYEIKILANAVNQSDGWEKASKKEIFSEELPDTEPVRKQPLLANRYDFGQSLSKAKRTTSPSFYYQRAIPSSTAATDIPSSPRTTPSTTTTVSQTETPNAASTVPATSTSTSFPSSFPSSSSAPAPAPAPATKAEVVNAIVNRSIPISSPSAFTSAPASPTFSSFGLSSSPLDVNSPSYMDLVNKYCFFGAGHTGSPMPING
ncbi:putative phosphatase regulatory subunit-domain-containing protein [Radiomyces spectabilis]|uniref:putative phosphatase regulatory subunit-domain-containing protein n=1 Tax=Radiomyces spectabilis TaxID=64574 RepID=UPI0022206BC8|nr:putative phosphatase regulatory subunit-domain-containing protein [Radiomyces spectabilis]KAI8366061.1 putative phosphatase regulatory subunit-domain-containing protein [Radiomyces spectabilis]